MEFLSRDSKPFISGKCVVGAVLHFSLGGGDAIMEGWASEEDAANWV